MTPSNQSDEPRRVGRPTASQSQELADVILDALKEFLLANRIDDFSMDKLARKARVGKPTIYSRFANKEALFQALLIREYGQHAYRDILIPSEAGSKASVPELMVSGPVYAVP